MIEAKSVMLVINEPFSSILLRQSQRLPLTIAMFKTLYISASVQSDLGNLGQGLLYIPSIPVASWKRSLTKRQ